MTRKELLKKVFEQLQEDMREGSFIEIEEFLMDIPDHILLAYLPEY